MQALNFFGATQAMMERLMAQILQAFQQIIPLSSMMNLIWVFIGGIFAWHFMEATWNAFTKGTAHGLFTAYWDLIRKRWMRIFVYGTLSLGTLVLVDNGFLADNLVQQAQNREAWANVQTNGTGGDLIHDFGDFIGDWVGNNRMIDKVITNPDGSTYPTKGFSREAPVILTLKEAMQYVTNAINGLAAADVYDQVDKQIQNALDAQSKAAYGVALPTYSTPGIGDTVGVMGGAALMPIIDGIFYVFNWFTFVWAQWTLTRTLLIQSLFLQLSWHLGLYFLPIFILMAYFHSLQGFLTNLLKNYFAMVVAGYIMASVAVALFSPGTWIGVKDGSGNMTGGIIQMAFNGLTLGVNAQGGADPGSFPWLTRTFARQVARGQVVWMFGACGLILGQVYDLVRNVLDGGFRANFQAGSAGSGAVFGGK